MSRKKPQTTNENGGRLYTEKKEPKPAKRVTILGRKGR